MRREQDANVCSVSSLSSIKLNNPKSSTSIQSNTIHIENVDKITDQTLAELMEGNLKLKSNFLL